MKQYAFWKDNEYPYLLGGEVVEYRGNRVKINGCGHKLVLPVALVTPEKGKSMQVQLQQLKTEYEEKRKCLEEEYEEKAHNVLALEK